MLIQTKSFKLGVLAAALAGLSTHALAQNEVLEELIVTGVAKPVTKLESTNSVTALRPAEVKDFGARSTAEIFRNLPGIQSEASSGDANANIKIRGLPISAGGARYLSIQEDGMPSLLIGDLEFATSDSFIRFDDSVGSVQAIRGGSGATQATNSPGGIVNFISKTGEEEGGSVAYTTGLDYDSNRIDVSYGKPLDNGWRYHASGYYRDGEGVRDVPTDIENGYQIKANVTKELESGFVRVHLKRLDESSPTYLPIPALYNGNGSYDEIGVPFDDGTLYFEGSDTLVRESGPKTNSLTSGFEADVTSIGFVGEFDLSDTSTFGFSHRNSQISGSFVSPFPSQPYIGVDGPSTRVHYFNTQLDSLDNTLTDLNFTKDFGAVSLKAGLFRGTQDYQTQWGWNTYFIALDGGQTPTTGPGGEPSFLPGHPLWGNCCQRSYDLEVENLAPYVALTGDIGDNLSWDASLRRDTWDVSGVAAFALDGATTGFPVYGPATPINYDLSYTSWSLGLNYAVTDNQAVFFNVSEGGSASAPTRVQGLLANGDIGDDEQAYSTVEQLELGYKYQGDIASVYVTLFDTETREAAGFEVTTQNVIENSYDSSGLEVEGDIDFGAGFGLKGSVTFTDAEITNTDNKGNTPRRQADYIFNLTPSYTSDSFTGGLNFIGTDEVYVGDSNNATFDGYIITNLFANYSFDEQTTISLNVNNLLDEEGFTEGENADAVAGDLVQIRPINGRSASISIRYEF